MEQKLKIYILLKGLCLGLKEVRLENDLNWMKISNFIQNKGLENSFSFILLVPHKPNTITFLFFFIFFLDCEFFNSVNIKPDKKLTYLFDKINPKPKFWRHYKNQINAIPYQCEQRGRGHAAYEETKKRSSGQWECVIVFG